MTVRDVPGPCPVCGAVSIAPAVQRSTLLAVSDLLVTKVLAKLGKDATRRSRAAYADLIDVAPHLRHTAVQVKRDRVDWALVGAWDVIPVMLPGDGVGGVPSRLICALLDGYVHELVERRAPHASLALQRRFRDQLGLPVYDLDRKGNDDERPLSAAG